MPHRALPGPTLQNLVFAVRGPGPSKPPSLGCLQLATPAHQSLESQPWPMGCHGFLTLSGCSALALPRPPRPKPDAHGLQLFHADFL